VTTDAELQHYFVQTHIQKKFRRFNWGFLNPSSRSSWYATAHNSNKSEIKQTEKKTFYFSQKTLKQPQNADPLPLSFAVLANNSRFPLATSWRVQLKTELSVKKPRSESTKLFYFSRRKIREIKHWNVSAVGGVHMLNCMSETAKA